MIFAKVAANLDTHPKIRKAGRDGREVFLFVLRKNAELDLSGVIPAAHVETWYLAEQLMMTELDASNGLSRCVTAGLLRIEGHAYAIAGWGDEWAKRPLTNAERQSKYRAKTDTSVAGVDKVTNSNDARRYETLSNVVEESRSEKSRGEERRVEKRARARGTTAPPSERGSVLPADWKPKPEHVEIAKTRSLDLALHVQKFTTHAKSVGRVSPNWDESFAKWLLGSWPESDRGRGGDTRAGDLVDWQLQRIREAEDAERAESSAIQEAIP